MSGEKSVAVVGGGAAGLVAAIAAAEHGASVVVFERMQRVGKKLLATGNGRCNLTNAHMGPDFFHGADRAFVAKVLGLFGKDDTVAFFERWGVDVIFEKNGRAFPRPLHASAVLEVLRQGLDRCGVRVIEETRINEVLPREGDFLLRATDGREFEADRVILATGGKAAPNLGSNGGGYKIVRELGHDVTPLFPTLVQSAAQSPYLKRLKGLKVDGGVSITDGEHVLASSTGEILFADYGLSGPPLIDLGRIVSERAEKHLPTFARLDLVPEWSEAELTAHLEKRINAGPEKTAEFFMVGFLHKRLCPVILLACGVGDLRLPCASLSEDRVMSIAHTLKNWDFALKGPLSFMQAQATAGGVDCRDIAAETLESLRVPGLYLTGELLDVDGDCGGYNLQWAWSTGFLAGAAAGRD